MALETDSIRRPQDERFTTTRWSAVMAAGHGSSPQAQSALEQLCLDYWPPLYAFALRRGYDRASAQDLTQAFFAHFLDRGYLKAADRTRGRFRTFLLTCFQHFLIHEWEKTQSAKRGGRYVQIPWEEYTSDLEARAAEALGSEFERHYDREWALIILDRALGRLRVEFSSAGEAMRFERLSRFLHAEPRPGEYDKVGSELTVSVRAVKVIVHRMRRRFGRLVREEIRQTVVSESDVADEMRYLIEVMSF